MKRCTHTRRGIVSNRHTYAPGQPYATIATCDRQTCVDQAAEEVTEWTGEKATFLTDVERLAMVAAS